VASFGARLGARLLDGVVMGVIFLVAAAVAAVVGWLTLDEAGVLGAVLLAALVYGAIEFVVIAVLRVGGEGNCPGQTLGKAAAGIRVVRAEDGSRAGYGPAFGRFLLNLVPVLGVLSCLSMLWTPDRRCWHDSWTGTRVEKGPVPAPASGNRWNPAILAICLALAFSLGTVGLGGYLTRDTGVPYASDNTTYDNGSGGYDNSGSAGGYGSNYDDGDGDNAPDTSSTPAPESPEAYSDVLTIGTKAQSDPDSEEVAEMLDQYFTAINERDYDSYRDTQAADVRADLSESQFEKGYASTTDGHAVLVDIVDTPGGGKGVKLTFTSKQDAADGPDGQTCTKWKLTNALSQEDGSWKMDGLVHDLHHGHTACE
jgi:uncharacterized RDD family membrane protein YckC